jgi:hypothetical protein
MRMQMINVPAIPTSPYTSPEVAIMKTVHAIKKRPSAKNERSDFRFKEWGVQGLALSHVHVPTLDRETNSERVPLIGQNLIQNASKREVNE